MEPVHFSDLRHMSRSPAHYRYSADHGVSESRAMRVGSCVHAIVLGGVYHHYDGERRGKAWSEFRDAHDDGRTIVTTSELEDALMIAQAVMSSRTVQELFEGVTEREKLIRWTYLGRECSSRLDAIGPSRIVDLKVTSCTDPDRFSRHALKSAINAQLAFYLQAMGRPLTSAAYVVAVESTPPYPVTVMLATERAIEAGAKLCRVWMERLLCCEAADEWPGYTQEIVPFDIPDWDEDLTLQIDGEEVAL